MEKFIRLNFDVMHPIVLEFSNEKCWSYCLHSLGYLVGEYFIHFKLPVLPVMLSSSGFS